MLLYLLRRIFLFIPTLIVISLITFFISVNAPGDPVEIMLNRLEGSESHQAQKQAVEKDYAEIRHKLGFDLPIFYFSLTDATVSDTLYKIPKKEHRETLKRLSNEYGNWAAVSDYYLAERKLESDLFSLEKDSFNYSQLSESKILISDLFLQYEEKKINATIEKLAFVPVSSIHDLKISFLKLSFEKNPYKKYIPSIHWYGFNNQYHRWLMNFIAGDFGVS